MGKVCEQLFKPHINCREFHSGGEARPLKSTN